ncbi:3-oxoacyl-[acyl-carrier-protein] reductase [Rhizobiales bacterium GAS188]|nr:3-oxoacyl-[acyl-carrier-protein] reductase [Rhizobiales bacterium GAS188]
MTGRARLTNKVAVVTGSAKGIGRAIAITLAEEGAIIVAADIDTEAGAATLAEIRDISPRSTFERVNIADHAEVAAFVDHLVRQFGGIDILVNNAGVTRQIDFFDLKPEEVDWIVGVNIKGTFSMMQAVARVMRERREGRIVNISSIAGKGYRNTSNIVYAASKGALIAMTRIAAVQLGKYGIAVNAVCPGLTETELMAAWLERRAKEGRKLQHDLIKELLADSVLLRINTPLDVAQAVLFLASDASQNITGQSLNVDSGMMWD